MRIRVRVRPGASRTAVGGAYDDGDASGPALVVRVAARPVDGAANAAVRAAVAEAFGLRPRDVHLVAGHQGRLKVLDVDGDHDALRARLAELL